MTESQLNKTFPFHPKGKKPAYVGDSVLHPDGSVGIIVGGDSRVSYAGKTAACAGDKVECPGHTGVILQGALNVSIGGKTMALEGDKTSCGGVIVSGADNISVLNRISEQAIEKEDCLKQDKFNDRFQLINQKGEPLANMTYIAIRADGSEERGTTDDNGFTHLLKTGEQSEIITIKATYDY